MTARTEPPYAPRPGDLLFQGAGAGAVPEAIAAVTAGINSGAMSRVPMARIIHAYGRPAAWNGPCDE